MTEHTQGGWHTGAGNGEGFIFCDGEERLSMGKEGETTLTAIARVFGDTDEDKANGELMAAAPKLLESLEAALGWLDLGDTRHLVINHVYGDKSALNETLRNAKKAILKARGG